MYMATKLVNLVIYHKELLPINSHDPSIRWSCEVTWHKINLFYFHLQKPMDTELSKEMTYYKRLPPLKPHDPLITSAAWGHVAIWKTFISTFTRPLNLPWFWHLGGGSAHICLNWNQLLVLAILTFRLIQQSLSRTKGWMKSLHSVLKLLSNGS